MYEDNLKINNGKLFNSLITEENFNLFLNSKLKIFSHKEEKSFNLSNSLFKLNSNEIKRYFDIYFHY